MDKNCISIGMCFVPNTQTHFDVRCGAISNKRHILATGTDQGVIVIWSITSPIVNEIRYRGTLKGFKKEYEKKYGLKLVPNYLLVSNANSVAFPVIQVEFAVGGSVSSALTINEDSSKDFKPIEFGEDILLSLHEDSTLCIWSLSSYRCLHKIRGPPFPIRSIKVLPDRRFLAIVGDVKVNIIDIWDIKLIHTLEISNPQSSVQSGSLSQLSSEEMSDMSSTPLINLSPRILTTACSVAPAVDCLDANKTFRNVCPLIFVAITTSNEMLLWDLTSSILSHKSDEQSFSGPVKVITEWDSVYEVNVPIFLKSSGKSESSRRKRSKRHKYPTLSEYIYELEHEQGKICVMDNYVFLMVGYRILVWYYEAHELTRSAELFSFSDDEFSNSKVKWLGLSCIRTKTSDLLCCWLRNGKMRMYTIPESNSKRHFEVLRNYKFPGFRQVPENVELYLRGFITACEEGPLYFMYFDGVVHYGVHGLKRWKRHTSEVDLKPSVAPKFTCVVEREGRLTKIELYSNGEMQSVDLVSYRRESMASPRLFVDVLSKVSRSWRVRQFIITEAINDHLERFRISGGCCVSLLHSTGDYLVVALENAVLVYSLSCLSFKFMVNACHFFQIRCIHNVCGLGSGEKGIDLVELSNYFVTVDSEGWMVFYSIHDLVSTCNSVESSDHVKIIIDEDSIYNNTSINGQSDFDFLGEEFDIALSNFFIYRSSYRGINRIKTRYHLRDTPIDRVALDKSRDMLYVLTSTSVLTWRVSTGELVYSYVYLSLYRQAILISSKADYKQLKSSLSISETLSMILSSKNVSEPEELRTPNYTSSLALFSEKYKRKLKCNLFLSHLTLSMKDNRYLNTQTHTNEINTQKSSIKGGIGSRKTSGITSRHTFKFVNSRCIYKMMTYRSRRCNKHTRKVERGGVLSFNYPVPVLIFTLEALLGRSGTDYLTVAKDCLFCYLGVPNGSLTIPLNYDLREIAYKLIKKRSILMNETQSLRFYDQLSMVELFSQLSKKPSPEDLRKPVLRKHSDEPMSIENLEGETAGKTIEGRDMLIGFNDKLYTEQYEQIERSGKKLSRYLKDCFPSKSIESRFPCEKTGEKSARRGSMEDGTNEYCGELICGRKILENRYLCTCVFLHESFLFKNGSNRNYRVLRSRNAPRNGTVDMSLCVEQVNHSGKNELDIWLLLSIMMNTESERSFNTLLEYMTGHIKGLDNHELDLHVSRALTNMHVCQSYKLKGKANLTQIHVCNCNYTVFTFGTKCGSCHNTQSKFYCNQEIRNIKNVNEDSSLVMLALITLDNYIYSLKSSIRIGLKHYTISSYVVQQLMTKLLTMEDNGELVKANQVQNKTSTPKHDGLKNCDLKTFFLDVFSKGFGVVWNLSTFSKQSILPDQIRYTKYSLLFREDFGSAEGICMDSAYFILFIFHYYHHLRDTRCSKILLMSCSQNTPLAIDVIGWIVKKRKLGNRAIISALRLIVEFMENYMELGFAYLPDLVGIVIKCLDPLDYNIRILLLKPSTNALFYLVKNIPMVDFHQDTQRFAVGSQSGYMIIYDIRTATKWRMFLGKQSQIACVAFGSNGSLISAYYYQIPCFMVWKCSSSGLIGSLLSSTSKEYKYIKLKPTNVFPSLNQVPLTSTTPLNSN